MTLTDIALLNLRRRKGKAVFLLMGLLIGVATVFALNSLVVAMTDDVDHKLEQYGANIIITPKTETLSLTYGGLALGGVSFDMNEILESDLERIRHIPNAANLAAVGPMVLGALDVNGKKVLCAGVDAKNATILKPWWRINGRLPGKGELMLGSEAAATLGLSVTDSFTSGGQELWVVGVMEPTGSQDDNIAFTDVKTAQELFGKAGKVSMVEVAAHCMECPIDEMVDQIATALPQAKVMAIKQVVQGRLDTISQIKSFSFAVSLIVLFVGGLMVLVTMMASVRERTAEIGVFRALGFRKSHIVQIIFTEAAIVSSFAGLLGYPLGLLVTKLMLPFFTESQMVVVEYDPQMAVWAVGLSLILGILSSAYPAVSATRMDPNTALRAL